MRLVLALLVMVVAAAAATHGRLWRWADRHNPWAPLRYADAPNWLTTYKLRRLSSEPAACQAFLAETPWRFQPVPDREGTDGCGWRNAVQIQRTQLQISRPLTLACPAAASLALWEHHVVQPQAMLWLGVPARGMEHFGSYACRDVAGSPSARRSEHAKANALDVSAITLQDGRRIRVAQHWEGGGTNAAFLQAIHEGACDLFNGALGPGYNRAHADHFHLDRGPYRICR